VNIQGWCGNCGESFRLAQIVEEGEGGRCPRCAFVYSHEYNAVVTTAVMQFLQASEIVDAALRQLADIAPQLHVDREDYYKHLDQYLNR
jgi:hypothetical protein